MVWDASHVMLCGNVLFALQGITEIAQVHAGLIEMRASCCYCCMTRFHRPLQLRAVLGLVQYDLILMNDGCKRLFKGHANCCRDLTDDSTLTIRNFAKWIVHTVGVWSVDSRFEHIRKRSQ